MTIDWLLTLPQYLIPQRLLSALVRAATHNHGRRWKNALIRWFVNHYRVDLSIAESASPESYASFNHFFTRALKTDARSWPNDPSIIVAPVDGTVSEIGTIDGEQLIQAKGRTFSLSALLADKEPLTNRFTNGSYATLYLAPRDYHRIHMPFAGTLQQIIYVPGSLFSVNARTARIVNSLYARNERVIVFFETVLGSMAVILVGALFVGTMSTVWTGTVQANRPGEIRQWDYAEQTPSLSVECGAELGHFNMGSTVIVLFPPKCMQWSEQLQAGSPLEVGQPLGTASGLTSR